MQCEFSKLELIDLYMVLIGHICEVKLQKEPPHKELVEKTTQLETLMYKLNNYIEHYQESEINE